MCKQKLFLVLSFCFCIFVVQNQFINGVYTSKEIQFKGSREFWKLNSFLPQGRLVLQRLPQFQIQFYKMQNRKGIGAGKKHSNTTTADNSRHEYVVSTTLLSGQIAEAKNQIKQIDIRLEKIRAEREMLDGLMATSMFMPIDSPINAEA